MKHTWVLIVAFPVLMVSAGAAPVPNPPHSADQRLRAIYTAEWDWRVQELGNIDDAKQILDHLPRVDAAAQDRRLDYWEAVAKQLDAIPHAQLSAAEKLNDAVYRPQIAALIANQRLHDFEMPANSDSSFWGDVGDTARKPFRTLTDYQNWIAQMNDLPRYFREQTQQMRAGLSRGFTPPRVTLQGREHSLSAVSDAPPSDTLFYAPFRVMAGIGAADQERLRAAALASIRDQVQPAYRTLLQFMRDTYVPGARVTLAASHLPNGAAFYRAKIKEFTTLDMDPALIHALGETEVARLHVQMTAVMTETGFAGDFPAFLRFLRTDPRFYAKTARELLMHAAWIAKQFDGKAALYFGYLPRQRFAIIAVPEDIAPFYTSGRGGSGEYLVNTYALETRPLYTLTALTLHESAPGHAFQGPIAAEHQDQPQFRQHVYISAYGEGWALYCEKLGLEMGMYETPYERFGMLGYQIWRAARLVVDTGIHAQGWSREQAIQYFQHYTALPQHEIETEVDRYISWPAQALSYYLGEMSIWKARAKAEAALGARFNLRAFHDTVLELGSVPLPVLEERIDRFITEGGVGPYPAME